VQITGSSVLVDAEQMQVATANALVSAQKFTIRWHSAAKK
jgi:hypothetical protein